MSISTLRGLGAAGLLLASMAAWGADEAREAQTRPAATPMSLTIVQDTPKCRYQRIAELKIDFDGVRPLLDGSVNGSPVPLLIDTGATSTSLKRGTVERLGLHLQSTEGYMVVGVGGETPLYRTSVDELGLGPVRWTKVPLGVAGEAMESGRFGGLVGADFLMARDLELSLADKKMRFFVPENCDRHFLAYWDKDAAGVVLESAHPRDRRPVVKVELDGKPLRALIDTGAPSTYIDARAAAKLGFTPDGEGVVRVGMVGGTGRHQLPTWAATFKSFKIGGEVVNQPRIRVVDLTAGLRRDNNSWATANFADGAPEMILGIDFLQTHRVLFANSQRMMYFSYLGGAPFRTFEKPPVAEAKP